MTSTFTAWAGAALAAALLAGPAAGQSTPPGPASLGAALAPRAQKGVAYLNGGVGLDEQEAMRAAQGGYNLHLTFANRTGEYRADVQVEIVDSRGQVQLALPAAGPLLYARLAPGTYRISATSGGQRLERTARLGHDGPQQVVFTWAPEPEAAPAPEPGPATAPAAAAR